ncbi:pyrimidine 5'-nucleotidase [Roseospira marina]|uniref:Pyrimidine 5'-nucleotidase n=1 Tax=Roseospira marina TaxID=140057 RepID=A0A5M6I929_9PROT|nr:pyrimidine 5'-nucleotidase [Roseospira marina]KAA5604774.1 pyrimidine 5'-nucleotidase [Roseospira marina]MBB4313456.1 putative hydrolase of the HAD superfamily [Roseospira marina]MBB5086618.1 putative hydrolase of the HAD superfamily [Roseospira marina]
MTPLETQLPTCGLRHVDHWVFDLDNTLYPASTDIFAQMDRRMKRFIADFLDLPEDQAFVVQKQYFHKYGTSMRGLMLEHGMDPHAFMDYVHDLDHSVIPPAPRLDAALSALEGRKIVFTNGSLTHAMQVLDRLGITRHFEAVFDIEAGLFVPKPNPETYDAMLTRCNLDPRGAAMVEDSLKNLVPAHALGMTTIFVRDPTHWGFDATADVSHCHHITDDLTAWLEHLVKARRDTEPRIVAV